MPAHEERTAAGFFPRLAALLLDRGLLWLALLFLRVPALFASLGGGGALQQPFLFRITLLDVLCWAVSAAYFVLLTYFTGATLGKRAMGLRVVTAQNERPGFLTVLYRETIGRYLSHFLCLGYLLMLFDRDKRALHDIICDTRVVYALPVAPAAPAAPRTLTVVQTDDPRRDWYKPYRV